MTSLQNSCGTFSYGDNGVYTIPKSISTEVNIILWQEFQLANYDVPDKNVSHFDGCLSFFKGNEDRKEYCKNSDSIY